MTNFRVITVGLSHYDHEPIWELKEAEQCRKVVQDLFAKHGANVQDWTPQATLTALPLRFDAWSRNENGESSEQPELDHRVASSIIYWVGHGEDTGSPDNHYRLALRDSKPPLSAGTSFRGADLFEYLLNQQRRRADDPDAWVLVILDTCGSGSGAYRIWSSFTPPEFPRNTGLIATTDDGAAFTNVFTPVLGEVLAGFSGNDTDGVPLFELLHRLEIRLGTNKVHHAFPQHLTIPIPKGDIGPLAAPVDIFAELRQITKGRPSVVVNHYYAKAQGAEVGELAWHFKGRAAERRKISRWLEASPGGLLVVTGRAGAGKSALLGMTLASTDEDLMNILQELGYDAGDKSLRPDGVTFDAVLHLSGSDIAGFLTDLCAALAVPAATNPDILLAEIQDLMARRERLTILVDALDESRDPFTIAGGVLRRLADLPRVRLILGTRRSLGEDPDNPATTTQNLIGVLQPREDDIVTVERDPEAVRAYAAERLRVSLPQAPADQVARAAALIAGYNQPFLFARLAVHEIISDPAWLQQDGDLARLIGSGHSGIFANAARRFQDRSPATGAVLHALAYAHGSGFPRTGGIWAVAASALTPTIVSDNDIAQALREAAPYILQDSDNGQAVYRLSHRTFAERYRADDRTVSRTQTSTDPPVLIADRLLFVAKQRELLSPYLRRHLAEHMGETLRWDQLAGALDVLNQLDPTSVGNELARNAFGRGDMAAPLTVALVSYADLAAADQAERPLIRALAAHRLRLPPDPLTPGQAALRWAWLAAATPHLSLTGHNESVTWVAFGQLPDGRTLLASSSWDGTIRLWDPATGQPTGPPLTAHTNAVTGLAFGQLPDGRTLLASSGFYDYTVRLWDPATGQPAGPPLIGHSNAVTGVAFGQLPDAHPACEQ